MSHDHNFFLPLNGPVDPDGDRISACAICGKWQPQAAQYCPSELHDFFVPANGSIDADGLPVLLCKICGKFEHKAAKICPSAVPTVPATDTASSSAGGAAVGSDFMTAMKRDIIRELSDRQQHTPSFRSDTQSRGETMAKLKQNGSYIFSLSFEHRLQEMSVTWWPQLGSQDFPGPECGETETCQPFVTNMLKLFACGYVQIGTRKTDTAPILNIPDPNAYKLKTIDNTSPDSVCYNGLHKVGAAAMTTLGEVKGGGNGDFSNEEIGQLTDGMVRLMNKQPFRPFMIAFLTDGRRFLFVLCSRDKSGYLFQHSAVHVGKVGWQILFGMMQAKPADLGYVEIAVPGFLVSDLLGIGSYSVVMSAEWSESAAEKTQEAQEPRVILPTQWTEHPVDGDGNCLFHSIAHQLQLIGVEDVKGCVYTHDLLRALALSRVDADPRFRLMMSDEEHLDLSLLNGYVDHAAIAALAAALAVNIVIFVPGGQQVSINADGNIGPAAVEQPVLHIVYNGHNHYNSVVSSAVATAASGDAADSVAAAVISRKRTSSQQAQRSKSSKRARRHDLPVAVKIFKEEHRHMRDHERNILEVLKTNNNVPSVVKSLDVCSERPALVISPAADKVLPVKGGVLANKTDFVKLLQVLEHAHKRGICHRDVKPHNIFKDTTGRVILNDWSSATDSEKPVPWAGTEEFYTPHPEEHVPQPADDLVALVRSVYLMYTNTFPRGVARRCQLSPFWQEALQYAADCDYDKLRAFFNRL